MMMGSSAVTTLVIALMVMMQHVQEVAALLIQNTRSNRRGATVMPMLLMFSSRTDEVSNNNNNNNLHDRSEPLHVLVTGASGRTGQLVFAALLEDPRFAPKALVRSEASARQLQKQIPETTIDQIVICDITSLASRQPQSTSSGSASSEEKPEASLLNRDNIPVAGLAGIESIVICTSAVPRISKLSLVGNLLKIPYTLIRYRKLINFRSLRFVWKQDQYPELVDYLGCRAQVDLACSDTFLPDTQQIVLVGSMGGTDRSNFLNAVGKTKTGTGNGDILVWKRKAEKYLIDRCTSNDTKKDMSYTIIHPGGLIDKTPSVTTASSNGDVVVSQKQKQQKDYELVLDVDDNLLKDELERTINRVDVAQLCVAALTVGRGHRVAFDCVARPMSRSSSARKPTTPTTTDQQQQQRTVAEQALLDFLQTSKTCDYTL